MGDVPRSANGAPDLAALMQPMIDQLAASGARIVAEVGAQCDGEQLWAEPGIRVADDAPTRLRLTREAEVRNDA